MSREEFPLMATVRIFILWALGLIFPCSKGPTTYEHQLDGVCPISALTRLIPYILRYRATMILGFISLIFSNLVMLAAPRVLQGAIDAIRQSATSRDLLSYAGLFLAVMIVQGVFRYYVRQTLGVVSRRIEFDIRNDLYRHLQQLTLSYFHRIRTGDIMSRCTNDLSSVRNLLGPGIMYSANAVIIFVAVVVVMLYMNATLAVMTLIPMIILPLFSNRLSKRLYERSRQVQEQIADISGIAQESIAGIRVVKAYGRSEALIGKFESSSRDYVHKSMALIKIQGIIWPMMGAITGMSSVILIWFGGIQVIEGTLTLGELVAFEAYLGFLMWPMMAFGWVINIIQRGLASMHRMTEILDAQPAFGDADLGNDTPPEIKGGIEFRNMTFAYGDEPVLKDISFRIAPGTTLAIIGSTGSGKSTLVNLIARLYDPPPGALFIDGVDIREIPLETLRRAIGSVPQDTLLFSRTVRENIVYGKPDSTDEQVRDASDAAQIWKDVSEFPQGMETLVGERGVTLSGGQKQRISIARAVITDPRILILDDSMSSVDTYTEEEILTRLRGVMKGRTSVIISHRISTIKDADRIIVLDEGRIVEAGTHEELLAQDGIYAGIHAKQLLSDSLEQL